MYLRAPPVIPGHVSAVLLAAPLDAPAHVPGAGGAGRGGRVGGAGRQLAVVPGVARHTAAQVHTPALNNRAANDHRFSQSRRKALLGLCSVIVKTDGST